MALSLTGLKEHNAAETACWFSKPTFGVHGAPKQQNLPSPLTSSCFCNTTFIRTNCNIPKTTNDPRILKLRGTRYALWYQQNKAATRHQLIFLKRHKMQQNTKAIFHQDFILKNLNFMVLIQGFNYIWSINFYWASSPSRIYSKTTDTRVTKTASPFRCSPPSRGRKITRYPHNVRRIDTVLWKVGREVITSAEAFRQRQLPKGTEQRAENLLLRTHLATPRQLAKAAFRRLRAELMGESVWDLKRIHINGSLFPKLPLVIPVTSVSALSPLSPFHIHLEGTALPLPFTHY